MGRWLPEQSDDYLRTARAVVYGVQQLVADTFRTQPDKIVEDENIEHFKEFLTDHKSDSDRVELLSAYMCMPLNAVPLDLHSLPSPPTPEAVVALPIMQVEKDDSLLPYVVHYTAKTRFTRLHKKGGCWRRPGHELKEVSYHATLSEAPYMSWCTDCWPSGVPAASAAAAEGTGSDSGPDA